MSSTLSPDSAAAVPSAPPAPNGPSDDEINAQVSKNRVIGDYALYETIGNGSFGKVRRGLHIPTRKRVAVKILNRQALATGNMDKKIRREIKILKLFNHAHICRLYDVLYTPGDIFVVMEYCGKELYDHIVRYGRLDEQQARHIFQQIVCALEYCHHFRVVHRDLKPENILYSPETKTAKLIDFGLANIMQDGEFLRTSCGSPNYAAPEVISGRLYAGPEVDVWSCGVVLYALVCGCLPFDEDSIPALFSKIKRGKFTIPPHVSPEAADLINQVLVVDPVLRITISQLRDHPWFATRLPKHLHYRPSLFYSVAHLDEDVMEQVRRLTNVSHREIRDAVATWSEPGNSGVVIAGRSAVIYNVLMDAKRQDEIARDATQPDDVLSASGSGTVGGGGGVSAAHTELNHGLVLSVSPAISLLLDTNDATSNKHSYNSSHFMPRSAHEIASRPCTTASLPWGGSRSGVGAMGGGLPTAGAFAFSNNALSSGPSSFTERVGSFQQARSLGCGTTSSLGSLPMAPPSSLRSPQLGLGSAHQLSSGMGSPSGTGTGAGSLAARSNLVGVVARTNAVYSADEELFHVQNNMGWRVGLMTDKRSVDSIAEICNVLKVHNMEWKVVAPYQLAVRRRPRHAAATAVTANGSPGTSPARGPSSSSASSSSAAATVIQVHLMRVQERHDKGFVVDFFFAKGCPMAALEMTIEIWRDLLRRMG